MLAIEFLPGHSRQAGTGTGARQDFGLTDIGRRSSAGDQAGDHLDLTTIARQLPDCNCDYDYRGPQSGTEAGGLAKRRAALSIDFVNSPCHGLSLTIYRAGEASRHAVKSANCHVIIC